MVIAGTLDAIAVAHAIRTKVLALTIERGGCYLSQALSSAEILATLYTLVLALEPPTRPLHAPPFMAMGSEPIDAPSGGRFHGRRGPDLDRFLVSPSHYAVAIYAALEAVDRLADGELMQFNEDGSTLEMIGAEHSPGFELTTGSFGQALSQAGGIAMARRLRGESGRTIVFMSDGELQEGQTWEACQAAAFYRLDRLAVVVDVNGQQVDGLVEEVMNIEPIADRVEAFGWRCISVDGHDVQAIAEAFETTLQPDGKPLMVLAYTDPARGVPLLEPRKPTLHYVRLRDAAEKSRFEAFLVSMQTEAP